MMYRPDRNLEVKHDNFTCTESGAVLYVPHLTWSRYQGSSPCQQRGLARPRTKITVEEPPRRPLRYRLQNVVQLADTVGYTPCCTYVQYSTVDLVPSLPPDQLATVSC